MDIDVEKLMAGDNEENEKLWNLIKDSFADEEPFIVDENGRVTNFDWNNPKHRRWIED